jgi:hypothetical protein
MEENDAVLDSGLEEMEDGVKERRARAVRNSHSRKRVDLRRMARLAGQTCGRKSSKKARKLLISGAYYDTDKERYVQFWRDTSSANIKKRENRRIRKNLRTVSEESAADAPGTFRKRSQYIYKMY